MQENKKLFKLYISFLLCISFSQERAVPILGIKYG